MNEIYERINNTLIKMREKEHLLVICRALHKDIEELKELGCADNRRREEIKRETNKGPQTTTPLGRAA